MLLRMSFSNCSVAELSVPHPNTESPSTSSSKGLVWKNGRGGGIRTPDPLVPNQMRYQTALRPDSF
jgi:hypothetical protein